MGHGRRHQPLRHLPRRRVRRRDRGVGYRERDDLREPVPEHDWDPDGSGRRRLVRPPADRLGRAGRAGQHRWQHCRPHCLRLGDRGRHRLCQRCAPVLGRTGTGGPADPAQPGLEHRRWRQHVRCCTGPAARRHPARDGHRAHRDVDGSLRDCEPGDRFLSGQRLQRHGAGAGRHGFLLHRHRTGRHLRHRGPRFGRGLRLPRDRDQCGRHLRAVVLRRAGSARRTDHRARGRLGAGDRRAGRRR